MNKEIKEIIERERNSAIGELKNLTDRDIKLYDKYEGIRSVKISTIHDVSNYFRYEKNSPEIADEIEKSIQPFIEPLYKEIKEIRERIENTVVCRNIEIGNYNIEIKIFREYNPDAMRFLIEEEDKIKHVDGTEVKHWNVFDGGDVWKKESGNDNTFEKIKKEFSFLNRGIRM